MIHNRLDEVFARCRAEGRAALIGYLTAGDPSPTVSGHLLDALAAEVDVLEIGMPFSDPMADGPVIQAASERALASGTRMDDVFALTAAVRERHPTLGIVLMGYANTPYAMGVERFAARAQAAGADGVLIVDIPPEENALLQAPLQAHGLHRIFLLAPTSTEERIQRVCAQASGFIYHVSLTGITGAEMGAVDAIQAQVQTIRQYTALPVCVGFGIKTPEQAKSVAGIADGVVIGSAFVSDIATAAAAASPEDMAAQLGRKARRMREALAQARRKD